MRNMHQIRIVLELNCMEKFHGRVNDLGWEIYPVGLYEILTSLKKWKKPIFITENGVADKSDSLRARFIIDHMKQIRRCLDEKVDVIGYLHWSLMDNYEWHEGYNPEGRFGLYFVDRSLTDLPRIMTKGAKALEKIISESTSTNQNGELTEESISKTQYMENHYPDTI